jgi:hypothetical protein
MAWRYNISGNWLQYQRWRNGESLAKMAGWRKLAISNGCGQPKIGAEIMAAS